ncbi:proline-rich transmembrane 1-like [Pelobates cultripes]|nr:proline-rich transmembrane 1-like [Pelobates cultripes]
MKTVDGCKYSNPNLSDPDNEETALQTCYMPTPYQQGQPIANYAPQQAMPGPTVIAMQPNVAVVRQPVPKDYLCLSIVNLLLCCMPLGIAALIYSCKTQDSLRYGDMNSAVSNSRTSFKLNMVALGIGIVLNLVWIGLVIYINVAATQYINSYYVNG